MKDNNVIDMTDRIKTPDYRERLKGLKVRLDLEQAKIAVSTSLLSIVILVTLANNNLMTTVKAEDASPSQNTRGIASLPSVVEVEARDNSQLVNDLAKRDLSASAAVGRQPTTVEKLAFGFLEGKYAVRLENGKLREIEFSDAEGPKRLEDRREFLLSNRELLPVDFDKPMKVSSEVEGSQLTETYQLINRVSLPVAKVQFRLDSAGRLLTMHVAPVQVASK